MAATNRTHPMPLRTGSAIWRQPATTYVFSTVSQYHII